MPSFIRPINQDQMFQIPLIALIGFLVAALLAWLLGFGRPSIAVAIALDFSGSTYAINEDMSLYNSPSSIMYQEVQAVRTYLQENSKLRSPNQVKLFAFAGTVQPLTNSFSNDSKQVESELNVALSDPALQLKVEPNGTNINEAISQGTVALGQILDRCRELLIVTDGAAPVDSSYVSQAKDQKVAINSILVGADAPKLKEAAEQTKGIYLSGETSSLEVFFTDKFFEKYNTNTTWLAWCLGGAWVSLMWLLNLPLDRWLLQGIMKLHMSTSGYIAVGNAFFWSILIPIIVFSLYGFPSLQRC